ncbi:MAG: hypothetical protein KGM96_09385 [Acidobacteriota bacterium]|nr:hypothetical protein [Acidobacteriota bacterium]
MSLSNRFVLPALICSVLVLFSAALSFAQTTAAASNTGTSSSATNGAAVSQGGAGHVVPAQAVLTGPNLSVSYAAQHDSTTGWANVLTPDFSYRFGRHASVDVNVPWYLTLQAYETTTVRGTTTTTLTQANNVLGDTTAALHFQASGGNLSYIATLAGGLPTGDKSLGVSTGSATYNFTQHVDYSIGPFTPDVEFGVGDSTILASHFLRKSYAAVGALANFQVGTSVDLPGKLSLDAEAYEAMPLAAQTVFGTIMGRGGSGKARSKQVLQGAGVAEDNGFTVELDVPLTARLNLAGTYGHSLIQQADIAGVSLTWTLRSARHVDAGAPSSPMTNTGGR